MHLKDDSVRQKLFMDVLEGTKAAVSTSDTTDYSVSRFMCMSSVSSVSHPLSLSAADVSVCLLSASGLNDGHTTPHPPQTVEKVCVYVCIYTKLSL